MNKSLSFLSLPVLGILLWGISAAVAAPPETLETKAKHGSASAQYQLGLNYQEGIGGVAKDPTEAATWFNKAAEQWAGRAIKGEAQAEYDLGLLYEHGYGLPQDDTKAFQLFEKAAKQGFTSAQLSLGLAYTQGKGVTRNIENAYFWLALASKDTKAIKDKGKTDELRDDASHQLSATQKAEADKRVADWKPVAEAADTPPAPAAH